MKLGPIRQRARLGGALLTFATFLAAMATMSCSDKGANESNAENAAARRNTLERVLAEGQVTIGYAGYPPYLVHDVRTGENTGYSVALAKAIFDPLNVTIRWHETTWDNMKQDLLDRKLDLMVEPIFMTIPRSAKVGFTIPYAYFGYAVAVVKSNETRFATIKDLDNPEITLAITQGVTDQEFAIANLGRARVRLIPGNDISITLTEVLLGKVDAALADVPTALEFVRKHPAGVKVLFADSPPATTPAAFMIRQDDIEFKQFLDNALLYLQVSGAFDALELQYKLPSFREKRTWIQGQGLKD